MMTTRPFRFDYQRAALALATLAVTVGCGRGGPERYEVSGTVNFAGKPVEVGAIALVPIGDTEGPLCGSNIEGGRYLIPSSGGPVAGKHRVEIKVMQKTGKKIANFGGELLDQLADVAPEKYSGPSSELTVEVSSEGANQFDFDLKK
jgi:hypothetical protein